MSHSKCTEAYPQEWHALALKGYLANRPILTPCANAREADKLRMRWYGFLRAIDAEAKTESPETTIVDGIGIVTYPMAAMGKTARKLSVSVEGSTLVHTPRDRLPEQLSILAGYDDLQAALAEADSAA